MESGATRTNAHTSMPEVRQADIHVHPGPSLPRTACPWEAHGQPAPPPLSPEDPAPTQPCRPRLTPGPPTLRLGAVPEEGLPASWKPRATPLYMQRAIVPQQEAGASATCPAGCRDTRGHSLPRGPRGAGASRSRRRGARPRCGPRQREWRVQRPAGQCAPCTERAVLQARGPGQALGPCRARVSRGPQSRQRSRPPSSQACRVGPVPQAPDVWRHQDGCAPAFRGDSAHPPSPAWTSPGVMHHRGRDKAWGGEGTSTTVWSPGPGPRGAGSPWGSLCLGRAHPAVPQPVLSGPHPGA